MLELFKEAATSENPAADSLRVKFDERRAVVGVVGLGYVGLPLARAFVGAGHHCIGFDVDAQKIESLNEGRSYIHHIQAAAIAEMNASGRFKATSAVSDLRAADAILICVPTPLDRHRAPDLSYVERTADALARVLRAGQLIVLESTTYPGTTSDVLQPILESSGLRAGRDFYLAFSPEREDPGNEEFGLSKVPKVVGSDDLVATALACALYETIVERTVPVKSTKIAEAVKLTENIFRSVNIALANELKMIFDRMEINVWEVIDAAKTKPFGYMAFYPGPGVGGHCIPVDPFYLAWKSREFDINAHFVELAGEVNSSMPDYVLSRLIDALNRRAGRSLRHSRILLLGLAYKRDVDDLRESPALVLMEKIIAQGASVDYHDAFIPVIPKTREHGSLAGMRSTEWDPSRLNAYDAVVIATDHTCLDYAVLAANSRLVIDTRNATRLVADRENIVLA